MSPTIGIALYPDDCDGDDAMTLLKRADVAMYQAAQAGRDAFRFCTAQMSAVAAQQPYAAFIGNWQPNQANLFRNPTT